MNLIDLSHTITPNMPRFSPAVPRPVIRPWMSHEQSGASGRYQDCTCEVSEVQMVTSLGTYLDSPYHFNPEGRSIEQLQLDQLVLPGVLVDCRPAAAGQPLMPQLLDDVDVAGKAVLFYTGWGNFWGQSAYYEYPFLSASIAASLRNRGARMAGIDALAVDDFNDPQRPAHVTLLHAGILIVENLANLAALPPEGFTFHAVPVKIAGAAAFPVRAYAAVPS